MSAKVEDTRNCWDMSKYKGTGRGEDKGEDKVLTEREKRMGAGTRAMTRRSGRQSKDCQREYEHA